MIYFDCGHMGSSLGQLQTAYCVGKYGDLLPRTVCACEYA